MRNISLGLHMGHDRSVAIIENGMIIGALAAERIDRKKHSISAKIPFETIDKLLAYLEISINDIKYVGITYAAVDIQNLEDYYYDQLSDHYKNWNFELVCVDHHLAHAASTFYTSGFDKSLVFIADGGGDLVNGNEESESVYIADKNDIVLVEQRVQSNIIHTLSRKQFHILPFMNDAFLKHQISIAKKYEQITYMIGFDWNQAGKTMGLASYGNCLIDFNVPEIKDLQFELTLDYIIEEIYRMYESSGLKYPTFINKYRQDIANTVQIYTEKMVIAIVGYLIDKYKINKLCLAGGLFLNCLLNHKILETYPDIELHICPAAGDDGQAIGAAFWAYRKFKDTTLLDNSKNIPYLGISYSNQLIKNSLENFNLKYDFYDSTDELCKVIATNIYENKIIGFFTGRSEIGPRALCHRSIIANATWGGMKDYINQKVKHREPFRPFAPVVLEEYERTFFNLKQTSPYMLLAPTVNEDMSHLIPSVVHVDKTARVQSVNKTSNPFIYRVIEEFKNISGVPVILNTSFNDNGEPIVESPDDAIKTFLNTNIDVLVLEHFIVYK